VAELDSRIMATLSRVVGADGRDEARMELALLRHLRHGLAKHNEGLPDDVVLLSSIAEYAESGQQVLEDLINGGIARIRRFVDYDRSLVSELVALGGSPGDAKEQLKRMRGRIGQGAVNAQGLLREALSLFSRLQHELDRRVSPRAKSLLDELLRS